MLIDARRGQKPDGLLSGGMLRKMYDWTFSLAARKTAQVWLAVIAFIESSVFLIPADVLFLPMALARPDRAYRYALIATIASTLGGIAGYLLGAYAFDAVARPVLEFYGKLEAFDALRACAGIGTTLIFLTTSGLAHVPPIKVVTILSGVLQVGLPLFIAACLVFRGARFYALAWALRRYGDPIREFIERRLGTIAAVVGVVLIAVYFLLKWVAGSGGFKAC